MHVGELCLAGFLSAGLTTVGLAQTDISPRFDYDMAYDSTAGHIVLYGGYNETNTLSDTWFRTGTNWTEAHPVHDPGKRAHVTVAYDSDRDEIVLFGGINFDTTGGNFNDVWVFDGSDWAQEATSGIPNEDGEMAYDTHRKRMVLYVTNPFPTTPVTETWERDGTNWSKITTAHTPPARSDTILVYDTALQKCVLFGGGSKSFTAMNDTWVYDGSDWTKITTTHTPPGRSGQGMAYDLVRQKVIMFGGATTSALVKDTWEFDGSDWTQAQPTAQPSARWVHHMTYDTSRQRVVLIGGEGSNGTSVTALGDTWEYDGSNWHQIVAGPTNTANGWMLR